MKIPSLRGGAVVIATAHLIAPAHAELFGITWDDGSLYSIDESNADVTKIGDTGVANMADIFMGSDGLLYGFTAGMDSRFYQIDPNTAFAVEYSTPNFKDVFAFEGAIAETSPGSDRIWISGLDNAGGAKFQLVDVNTGAKLDEFVLEGAYDFNGWGIYGDSLIGLNRESGQIQSIDLASKQVTDVLGFPGDIGEVGGWTVVGDKTYIATGGPGSIIPGSNQLFMATGNGFGDISPVGNFGNVGDYGFSGIAAPEPFTMAGLAAGLAILARRAKR